MSLFLWQSKNLDGCVVLNPPNLDDEWEFDDGAPRLESFTDAIPLERDSEVESATALNDNLYGAGRPVISRRAMECVQKAIGDQRVEFLPAEIVDGNGRVLARDYFIVHPLDVIDCVEPELSGVSWNTISSNQIQGCKGLVFKTGTTDGQDLFRPKHWGQHILVSEKLVHALREAGLSGLHFWQAEGFTGMPPHGP